MYNGIDVLMGAEDAAVNNPEAKVCSIFSLLGKCCFLEQNMCS